MLRASPNSCPWAKLQRLLRRNSSWRYRLDALGDDLHAEAVTHVDDGAHQHRVGRIVGGVTHERLVDLERADRKLLQC